MYLIERHFSEVRIYEDEISPTLRANAGTGGGNVPVILEYLNVCYNGEDNGNNDE